MDPVITTTEAGARLADRVYEQLLEFIVAQDLDHGNRLPSEHELSRMTGVSRPIVREALTRLQADGVVESRRGSGSFVRQRPGERQIQHLRPAQVRARLDAFEVRVAVEPVAARLAAQHRTEDELKAISQALQDLVAAHAAGEPAGEHDLSFHLAVAAASHNPMFQRTLEMLEAQVEGLIVPSLTLMETQIRVRRIELEHEAIIEAIVRGDGECAEAAMRLHLTQARSRALRMRW